MGAPTGDYSLSKMSFSDLEATVRVFESTGLGIPDSFLDSLWNVIVYSAECNLLLEVIH